MRDYNAKQAWKQDIAGVPVGDLMPGAVPSHIVEWGPGVNVSLRGIAYVGTPDGAGKATDHGTRRHRLHRVGQP